MRGEIAVIQDADLEYDPGDLPRLVRPILDGRADAVFGSRFLSGEYRRVLYFWHSLGNGLLTGLCNVLCDLNFTDMETGYKAVRADLLRQTPLRSRGFGFEPELTVRLAQWGVRLYEVPVSYAGRTYLEGKKVRWADGLRAIGVMIRCRFLDRRFTTHDGYAVLVAMRRARGLNRWLFRQIAPWVGDRVLEAGCGIGNLTELLLERDRLIATDNEQFYVEMIGRRFGHLENVETVEMDLARPADYDRLERRGARHDRLPERPGAHRGRRGGARPVLPGPPARRARDHPGPAAPLALHADRPGPRPRTALRGRRAAAEAGGAPASRSSTSRGSTGSGRSAGTSAASSSGGTGSRRARCGSSICSCRWRS